MAYGIYAKPVGPGPATPAELFIDSNLTFPQTVASVYAEINNNDLPAKGRYDFKFSGWDGAGTAIAIPTRPICWSTQASTSLIPSIHYVKSLTFPDTSTLRVNYNSDTTGFHREGYNIYKLWPQGNQSYGITFSNSVNFFAINDAGVVDQCVWAYQGSVPNGFQIPDIAGVDMSRIIVFANWSDANVVIYDGSTRRFTITANHSNNSGSNAGGTIGKMNIVVFGSKGGVPEHNGGLNIYNPSGTQCVFSTLNSPFAFRGFMPASGGSPGIAYPMIAVSHGVGAIAETGGGWQWQHLRGHTMSGGTVGTGWGPIVTSWTDRYGGEQNSVISLSLPYLDASNYFATP